MSLKPKKKVCKGCGNKTFIFSKGLCRYCASKNYAPLKKTRLNKVSPNKKKRKNRWPFFKRHIDKIKKNNIRCQECGGKLGSGTANVCHILPKSNHPEVEFDDNNIMYYCFECHHKFDVHISDRPKMKSFPVILKKYKRMESKLKNSRITKELKQLREYSK